MFLEMNFRLPSSFYNVYNSIIIIIIIINEFKEKIKFNGSRYVAELLLKDENAFIPDHYSISYKHH